MSRKASCDKNIEKRNEWPDVSEGFYWCADNTMWAKGVIVYVSYDHEINAFGHGHQLKNSTDAKIPLIRIPDGVPIIVGN